MKNFSRSTASVILSMLFLTCLPQHSSAQGRIDTNRPGFSSSPYVMDKGLLQLETGFDYQKFNGGSSLLTLPYASLRFGMKDDIELLLNWNGWSRFEPDNGNSNSGITDAALGVKIQMTDDNAKTMFAFMAGLTLPVGDSDFSTDEWDPSIGLAWTHSGSLSWGGTAVIAKSGSDYRLDNGVKISFDAGANGSAFVEWQLSLPEEGDSAHQLNGGYVWWRGLAMQFDVNASLGLNDEAPDYILGAGWSYRF